MQFTQGLTGRPELYLKSNRSSHSSDTSSAYSGSDTMTSGQGSLDPDADEVDLSGLVESIVDSDEEEDLAESMDVSINEHIQRNYIPISSHCSPPSQFNSNYNIK